MTSRAILDAYRFAFVALIVVASAQTIASHEVNAHGGIALVAGIEIAGALLLAWRPAQLAGLGLLLMVFATAQILSALDGEWPTRFAQYAASALVIVLLDRSLPRRPAAEPSANPRSAARSASRRRCA